MKENWKILKSEYLHKCRWLTVRKDAVQMPSGHVIDDFYVLEYPTWVNVIAVTPDGNFLLERQYRHGIQKYVYELPAGCVDSGESPLEAAKRELLEETGYAGGEWKQFMVTVPNASAMNNYCYTFLAEGVCNVDECHQEASEDIEVDLVDRSELMEILENGLMLEGDMVAPVWRYLSEKIKEEKINENTSTYYRLRFY